jgi:thiol-disulfide isomerase/thioredoxin
METDEDVLIPANKAEAAPEIAGDKWINSDPLTIKELRGKVVLVDFWTFGCYNCVNTLPTLRRFHEQYGSKGLVIVGVETPETPYERIFDNLVKAVNKRGIEYPVVTDYDNKTWDAYGVNAWPTVVIVDKSGRIRYVHVGEGQYAMQESVITKLLAEDER